MPLVFRCLFKEGGNAVHHHYIISIHILLYNRQLDDSDRASVFLRDEDGRTGLHYAALIGNKRVMFVDNEGHGAKVIVQSLVGQEIVLQYVWMSTSLYSLEEWRGTRLFQMHEWCVLIRNH